MNIYFIAVEAQEQKKSLISVCFSSDFFESLKAKLESSSQSPSNVISIAALPSVNEQDNSEVGAKVCVCVCGRVRVCE